MTIMEASKKYESQSSGIAEGAVQTVEGQVLATLHARGRRLNSKVRTCIPAHQTLRKFSLRESRSKKHIPKAAQETWARCLFCRPDRPTCNNDTWAWTNFLCLPKLVLRRERGGKQNSNRSSNDVPRQCERWLEGAEKPFGRNPIPLPSANEIPTIPTRPTRRRRRFPEARRASHGPGESGPTVQGMHRLPRRTSGLQHRVSGHRHVRSPPSAPCGRRGQNEPPLSGLQSSQQPLHIPGPGRATSRCAGLGRRTVRPHPRPQCLLNRQCLARGIAEERWQPLHSGGGGDSSTFQFEKLAGHGVQKHSTMPLPVTVGVRNRNQL